MLAGDVFLRLIIEIRFHNLNNFNFSKYFLMTDLTVEAIREEAGDVAVIKYECQWMILG